MKGWVMWTIGVAAVLSLAGCGGGAKEGEGPTASATSPHDTGPRAAEAPVDDELAEKGEALFKSKTCSTCHAFGARITGPDLAGVTHRRSAEWMENQMLHPDVMTKEDPIARELLGKYAVQMPNLMLKPEEAKALIEYAKKKDKELEAEGKLTAANTQGR
jgi:cytochrome c551/c552